MKLPRPFVSLLFAVTLLASILIYPLFANGQTPSAQSMPDWQKVAGSKMAFDVVSIKQDLVAPGPGTVDSNIPLGAQDMFTPTGGLLSSKNVSVFNYMVFAYKLTPSQLQDVRSQLPKWANTDRYDIEARGAGNPTKDQFRLMMQSLLADRFKLAVHWESKQRSVFALVLDKGGKMGPHLQLHPTEATCSNLPPPPGSAANGEFPTVAGGFPEICGVLEFVHPSTSGRVRIGGRNVPMQQIGTSLIMTQRSGVDRPIVDKTGLGANVDFVIEFTPQLNGPQAPGSTFQPDESGPTFLEALKEQLGLKLEPQSDPVDVLVVDHIEQPSAN